MGLSLNAHDYKIRLDAAARLREHGTMNRRLPVAQLGLVGYGVLVGICANVLGAWVSSGLSGGAGTEAWIGVAVVIALAGAWFAESVVAFVGRLVRPGLRRFPASR